MSKQICAECGSNEVYPCAWANDRGIMHYCPKCDKLVKVK